MGDRDTWPPGGSAGRGAPAGGRDGFERFVAARQHHLLRCAYLVVGNVQLAEDLLQEALIKLALNWSRIHTDPEAFIRTVLYRDAVSWWRRRREFARTALPERAVGDSARDATSRIALAELLARLTPRQRAVLVLRYFDDLSIDAAAEVLGVPPGTVKSQTHAALRRLRELMPEPGDPADLRGE